MDVPFTRSQSKASWRRTERAQETELGKPESSGSGKSNSLKVLEHGSHRVKATLSKLEH